MRKTIGTRTLAALVALVGMALIGAGALASSSSPASALTNCSTGSTALDGEETAFLGLINEYRSQNGLNALTISTNLNRAATWMTNDLATNAYFSHTDSLGRSPYTRATNCGYPQGAGENLAAGSGWSSAQSAFDAWKASPGHNANMLGAYYKQIGISRFNLPGSPYGWYWATEFGATDDGTGGSPAPTNTPTQAAATNTPTPVPTQAPSNTPTPAPSATATPTRTPTPAPTQGQQQPTNTPTPVPTQAQQPASTPTPSPTTPPWTPSVAPSGTATPTPTKTPTPAPTSAPSATPTNTLALQPGANLLSWPGNDAPAAEALKGTSGIVVVYAWDPATGSWQRYAPGLPSFVNNLAKMEHGRAYWFVTKTSTSLPIIN